MPAIPAFIIAYSNSDFTNPHELVLLDEAQDCRNDFTHMGVKYSGMETCRHLNTHVNQQDQCFHYQHQQHNWVRIGLKQRALLKEVKISTQFFTGNQVRAISLVLIDELSGQESRVLERAPLAPDSQHTFNIPPTIATECLMELYYEGGITRIHFMGQATEEQSPLQTNILEQATISHVSNDHYGNPQMAVMGQRKEMYMRGWESARTGFGEQALFHLQKASTIQEIVVDTYLHRLNAPLSCHVFGLSTEHDINTAMQQQPTWCLQFEDGHRVVPANFQEYMLSQAYLKETTANPLQFNITLELPDQSPWQAILPFAALQADTYHRFKKLNTTKAFTHLLYLHYPNGGIHGLKVFGIEE